MVSPSVRIDGALDAVLELADVAGPRVGLQLLDGGGRQHQRLLVLIAAEPLDEMRRQHRDVVGPLAQRRNRDRKHRQAEIEILAELPRRDLRAQVAVGRGDDAHVHLQQRGAADALEALFFERAEDLRLQVQRQIADFVEEQGAAVRQLEFSGLARAGAGERAFLVAEQLGFEQVLRNRRAVDRDKRTVGSRTEHVQRAGEQLLAGAALAFEQHRRVGARRALQRDRHLLQPRVFADDLRRATPCRKLLTQQEILGRQAPLRERALDHQQQVIGIDRLGEKVQRAFPHGRHGVLNAAERGHHDHRHLGIELLGGTQHTEPITVRQPEVGQHDARTRAVHGGDGFRLVACFDDEVPLRFERVAEHGAQRVLVLHQQDRWSGRARARAHRSQPAGTPALRASSSRLARAFLPSSTLLRIRSSSLRALSRSRSMPAR